MSNDYDGVSVDLVPGTVRGYRSWCMTRTLKLTPIAHGYGKYEFDWKTDGVVSVASCPYWDRFPTTTKEQQMVDCSCGFYAKHSPRLVKIPPPGQWTPTLVNVYGAIAGHGKVVLGTKGFRAERATIEALYPMDDGTLSDAALGNIREGLGQLYRVPVYESWRKLVRDFPPADLEHLSPELKTPTLRQQLLRVLGGR